MVLERTLESPLDCKEIKAVNPKGNQSWISIGRTDAEVEAPILWPPDVKNQLTGKDSNAGKDWRQEEKGTTEDEMVGWHHWLNGHDFEQTLGNSEEWGNLACSSSCGHKELNTTQRLNNNNKKRQPTVSKEETLKWASFLHQIMDLYELGFFSSDTCPKSLPQYQLQSVNSLS